MDMKERILDIGQRLIQQRGVNGFSYADIAKEVGVAKPSLHHHFATKTDLVVRLMERYSEQLREYLASVSGNKESALDKLTAYCALYRTNLDGKRACMGGMLSAEANTLDPQVQPMLQRFFETQRQWLVQVLETGASAGELHLTGDAEAEACNIIASMQGALVVSRSAVDTTFFDLAERAILDRLGK